MNNTVYIHYGSDHFDRRRFHKIRNAILGDIGEKPKAGTGLWASPVDSETTWGEWCDENNFYTDSLLHSFKFTLLPTSRVLYICTPEQLEEAKEIYQNYGWFKYVYGDYVLEDRMGRKFAPDFERLAEEYDAMYVRMWWGKPEESSYWQLYGWDVDSLLVFNPNVINEIQEVNYGTRIQNGGIRQMVQQVRA